MTDDRPDRERRRTVERAGVLARGRDELLDGPSGLAGDDPSPAGKKAVAEWVTSGDHDRIVGELTADDSDIASQ